MVQTSRPWPMETQLTAVSLSKKGYSDNEVSRETGVPRTTVARWRKIAKKNGTMDVVDQYLKAREDKPDDKIIEEGKRARAALIGNIDQLKSQLIKEMGQVSIQALNKIKQIIDHPLMNNETPSHRLQTLVSTLTKMVETSQLLSGEPTNRTEDTHNVSGLKIQVTESRRENNAEE